MEYALNTAKKVKVFSIRFEEEEKFLGKVIKSYDSEHIFAKEVDVKKYLNIRGFKDMVMNIGSLQTTAKIIPKIIYKYE